MKMKGYVDVLIPRGGAGLIKAVVENATIPVIETGTGNCHIYIDKDADIEKAVKIIVNAKGIVCIFKGLFNIHTVFFCISLSAFLSFFPGLFIIIKPEVFKSTAFILSVNGIIKPATYGLEACKLSQSALYAPRCTA